jgi:ABC-type transporter Mla MlaB component
MLRVTAIPTGSSMTLKLEGSLSGPWVDELRNLWTNISAENVTVQVDLRALNFLDRDGTSLLLRMENEGSRLTGISPFIRALLRGELLVRTTRVRKSKKREN